MSSYAEDQEPVSFDDVTAVAEGPNGLLIEYENQEIGWIPKKFIHEDSEVYTRGNIGTLIIPRWLAKSKGMIDE